MSTGADQRCRQAGHLTSRTTSAPGSAPAIASLIASTTSAGNSPRHVRLADRSGEDGDASLEQHGTGVGRLGGGGQVGGRGRPELDDVGPDRDRSAGRSAAGTAAEFVERQLDLGHGAAGGAAHDRDGSGAEEGDSQGHQPVVTHADRQLDKRRRRATAGNVAGRGEQRERARPGRPSGRPVPGVEDRGGTWRGDAHCGSVNCSSAGSDTS